VKVSTEETLSIANPEIDKLKAYPNPVKEALTLSGTDNINSVAVFNMLGQQVIAQTINAREGRIGMAHLATGVYIVKITSGETVKAIRVNKE
jgi:hypothetical protein